MKLLKIPNFRQAYSYDCGPTVALSILAYYGIETRLDKIMKVAKTTKSGTPVKNLIKLFQNYDLNVFHGTMSINLLKNFINRKIPVIIIFQAWPKHKIRDYRTVWNHGHYAIAIGYDRKNIYFEDPSLFNVAYLPVSEFLNRWHDKDKNKKYLNYGIVVYGKKFVNLDKIVKLE